ncbi:Hsp70 family protein [Thermomonospora umbrina]|uniref:Molecular chaperone DnaK n=1 Tax=Thermomonospora umbrina TaxID=111806 RepID=A0A3D9SZV2_9ACTN|nr:Hsp70 family protein [Thermomonospora umbrina]REE97131.1 molecular chaperone DnaK [Thermomonospora umbrina]
MTRTTIDFGIDLGTTNSAIAKLNGVEADIVKNNEGHETTPSAVMIDRRGRLFVGRAAKERNEIDPDNTCVEFKLRMGTAGDPKVFKATDRSLGPEELSAEVLKSLRRDVAQRTGEEIDAAVITVPAAFELSACEATRRAAGLAGLRQAPLLQEPTAAALAHGFQSTDDNSFWLVYDFGGGTFDAAIVNIRDGEFTVVNHRGDNFLGGKLLDWAIVERLLIPAAAREHGLGDLRRGDPRWIKEINKLKLAAEAAKIRLSQAGSAEILVELRDTDGDFVEFEYDLTRSEVERLTEPLIVRSVNLCRNALTESGLGPSDIEKVLLVGGPTLSPYLRERLADPVEGLGIPIDHGQDPITAVARGAAIFAGGQLLDAPASAAPLPPGRYAVALDYQPVGPDTEPLVGGTVSGGDIAGFTIEFVNTATRPAWRSGAVPLTDAGAFTVYLRAERGVANAFQIELADATGAPRKVTPGTLTYTVGVVDTQPPLTQSIGIGLAGNEVEWLIKRGTPLPARRRVLLRTTVAVSAGSSDGMILIPVLEGEHTRADRNTRIGRLEVKPEQVRRDVPEGSEIDLTITIDESRLVVARAYVALLDEEFEHVINLGTERVPDADELARDTEAELRRLEAARREAREYGDARSAKVLERIEAERIAEDVDAMVKAAPVDRDAATAGSKRLQDLKAATDEVEAELEWPKLTQEARDMIDAARQVVLSRNDAGEIARLGQAEASITDAISAHDPDLLRQRIEELRVMVLRILSESGELDRLVFEDLERLVPEMGDPAEARRLVSVGGDALRRGDLAMLKEINAALRSLLPTPPLPPDPFSTVRRGR